MKPVHVGTGGGFDHRQYSMSAPSVTPFDAIKLTKSDGTEYWSARDLMPLLGYPRWQPFNAAIERAITSCAAQGHEATIHFLRSTVKTPNGRPSDDVQLSRFGAYLTAMNGDPRKPNVAMAQGYFAVKTREAELNTNAPKPTTTLEMLQQTIAFAVTQEKRVSLLEEYTATLETQTRVLTAKIETITNDSGYFTIKAFAHNHGFQLPNSLANPMGRKCSKLCRERGLKIGKAPDERHGKVNTYPEAVIYEVAQSLGLLHDKDS
jgi:DNA-damage-inducible protein D